MSFDEWWTNEGVNQLPVKEIARAAFLTGRREALEEEETKRAQEQDFHDDLTEAMAKFHLLSLDTDTDADRTFIVNMHRMGLEIHQYYKSPAVIIPKSQVKTMELISGVDCETDSWSPTHLRLRPRKESRP